MKKIAILTVFFSLMLMSCSSEPSLQKYFVESTNSNDFIAVDVSANILRLDKNNISAEENKALDTFEKMNILAFKNDGKNNAKFETEKTKVATILKNPKYQELMKMSRGTDGGAVYFVGENDNIDEFVLYGSNKDSGFAIVRVLGDKMNPTSIVTMLSLIQKANLDIDQLKPLEAMVKM